MNLQSSHPTLSSYVGKYPSLRGILLLTYNDLLYGQCWSDVEVLELPVCGRLLLKGVVNETKTTNIVLPCSLSETLSIEWLSQVFDELKGPREIHLGIVSDDSSIVYYRIGDGIIKPPL